MDHSSHVFYRIGAGKSDESKLIEAKRKSIPPFLTFICLLLSKRESIVKGEK